MKESGMTIQPHEHAEAIEDAVRAGWPIARQFLGLWRWVVITQAEAEQAIASGEHAWLRVHVPGRVRQA